MIKQLIQNINKCLDCPFVEWDYDPKGNVYHSCQHSNFDKSEEIQIIDDIGNIPDWCPLPEKNNND